ncbi:hypothetical protein GCM10020000_40360 [Streptomyces olivoverticillatus]
MADEVRSHFGHEVLRTSIPRSVRISEAPSYGQTVLTYDPGSSGALSYLEAAREIALRGSGCTTTVAWPIRWAVNSSMTSTACRRGFSE